MKTVSVRVHRRDKSISLPAYQTKGSAGMDLIAHESLVVYPQSSALVKVGITLELPEGWEAQIRPRSGLALKFGITVLNSPSTIDSDFRSEISVLLYNSSKWDRFTVNVGERIAQMLITEVPQVQWDEVDDVSLLSKSDRGGFGSTGR